MEKDFYEITKKAIQIVKKLGYSHSYGGYYDDECHYEEYEFDKLKMTYYEKSFVIYFDDVKVIDYDFKGNVIYYVDGKWTELVDVIYNNIDTILKERRLESEKRGRKIDELNSLKDYFIFYIECVENKNKNILKSVDDKLENNGIKIVKNKCYSTIRNLCTGDDDYIPYYTFSVFYNNEEVAYFNANKFNVFPNLEHYSKKFKNGEWVETFKSIMNWGMKNRDYLVQQQIDSGAEESIRKFRRMI